MKYKLKYIKEIGDVTWNPHLNIDIFKIKDNLCYYIFYDYDGKTRIRIINLINKSIIYEQEIGIQGRYYQSTIDDDNNFHFVIVDKEDNIYYGKLDNKRNLQIEAIGNFPNFVPYPDLDEEETPLSNLIIDNGKPMFIYTKLESHIDDAVYVARYGKFYLFYKDTNWHIEPLSYDEENKFRCVYTYYHKEHKDGITIDTTIDFFSLDKEPRTPPLWLYDNSVAYENVEASIWYPNSLIYFAQNFFPGATFPRMPNHSYPKNEIIHFDESRDDIYAIITKEGKTGSEQYITPPQITDVGKIIQDGTCEYKIIAHKYYRNMNGKMTGSTNPFENNWNRIIQEDTGLIWEALNSGYPREYSSTPVYYERGEWIFGSDIFIIYVIKQAGWFSRSQLLEALNMPNSTEDGAEITIGTAVVKVYNFNTKFFRKFVTIPFPSFYYPDIYEFIWNPELYIFFDFYQVYKPTGSKYLIGVNNIIFYDETNNIIDDLITKDTINYDNRDYPIIGSISQPILTGAPLSYNEIKVEIFKWYYNVYLSGNKFICKINDNNYAFSPGYRFIDGKGDDYMYPDLWTFDLQKNVNNYYTIREIAPFLETPYASRLYGLRIYKIDNYLYTIHTEGVGTWDGLFYVGTIISKLDESCNVINKITLSSLRHKNLVCVTLSDNKFHLLFGIDNEKYNVNHVKYDYVVVDSDLNIIFEEENYIDLSEYPIKETYITDMRIKQDKPFSIPLLCWDFDGKTYIALLYKDEYSGLIPLLFFYPYTEEKETKHAIISTRRIKENG